MKKEPCIRFGIRIRPKISENPADSRNSSPPYAMLFTAKVSQSDMSDAGQHAPPSPEGPGPLGLSGLSHKQREQIPSPREAAGRVAGCEAPSRVGGRDDPIARRPPPLTPPQPRRAPHDASASWGPPPRA